MSTAGQGDQISETNKDDEPEISSTTSENKSLKEAFGESNETSAAAAAMDQEDTEIFKALEIENSNLPSSSFNKKPVTDAVIPSTSAEIQKTSEIIHEGSGLRVDTSCDVGNTEVSHSKTVVDKIPPEAVSSDVSKEIGIESSKTGVLKDIPELIQAETDKDGLIKDNLVVRWDENDDEDDATEPIQTDYVLEMLNKKLGEDAREKPENFKITNEEENIKSVKDRKSDKNEENYLLKTNNSFEESLKIIAEIDSLTQDEKIDKTPALSAEYENPVTVDKLVNQLEDDKTPKDTVKLEKPGIEESKSQIAAIEVSLKTLTKDDEVMDVDNSGDIIEKEAENSIMESQKIINEIDSLTQDDEINKTTKLPEESDNPITFADSYKQLENVEKPVDEIDSEKPDIETELNAEIVSIETPFKPLAKDDKEMDVDKSEEKKYEKEIGKRATTASISFEECQKTIAENDSLTQDDKIEKTAELPSESYNPLTFVELDKQLDNVESIKNEFDEPEKPDIKESKAETIAITVPSNLLSKDDEVMHLDDSNNIVKDTSAVDDFTAEVTQENIEDTVQMEKVESIKDKEVLDNIEDKQDTSNISHDIIADALKPAETLTSESDIPSMDKITLKDDPIIPFKEQNEQSKTKTIEKNSEISQPVDDNNKESDANDTVQDLDDKLSTVQSIGNKSNGQEIQDAASSVQDNRKSLDEHNIVHKSSESQRVDEKILSMNEIDDRTLEALNILVNTETEDKSEENASILDDSLKDTTISPNKHHRINKPDVMLDIPTQDFSDIEAELSDSEINDYIEKDEESSENNKKGTKIDEKLSESNKKFNVIPEISGITKPTIQIDATTSKLNITTISPFVLNQVSSTDDKIDEHSSTKTQDIVIKNDDENVSEKSSQEVEKPEDDKPSSSRQVDDQQPSGSKDIGDDNLKKLTSDDTDDVQVSDSLGLLAESSRVMDDDIDDDDEEPEELEHDDNEDNEDDEDFDPYDESSSQMLEDLEDTDESNPPTEEKPDEIDVIDADEQTDKQSEIQPDKINNILAKVLGSLKDVKPPVTMSGSVLNYVEVEESSDSDDVEEISKLDAENLISVKVPSAVDVMLTSGAEGGTSAMHSNKDEVVISVPKPHSLKVAKINTSEVTIKSAIKNLESLQIPETTSASEKKSKDEVFNIDSEDEEEKKIEEVQKKGEKEKPPEPLTPPKPRKCINPHCKSTSGVFSKASRGTIAYYTLSRRSGFVCAECTEEASERSQALVNGIKDLRPLLALEMDAPSNQLVEISDSDEDDEPIDESEKIGEKGAKYVLDNLVDVFNEVWVKYELDSRLKHTQSYLMAELDLLEAGAKELDAILDECQIKTDTIRTDFYKDYERKRRHVGGIVIHDTPFSSYSHTEKDVETVTETETLSNRYPKRRSASFLSDPPAKKQATSVETLDKQSPIDQSKMEDDKDISVVKLSAESAPASLPPHGELVRPALYAGMSVYAMRNAFGTWNKAKILEIVQEATPTQAFTQCRVKFEHKVKNSCKVLAARCLAYSEPCEVRYTIGTRVVALFKDPQSARLDAYYAGVVAEVPNPVNNFRYLVFFDDGYAQYIQHADTRLVCQASALVWEEVHPFIHDFVRNYLKSYPERPMVRLRQGETLNTEWNGKWWSSRVLRVDASIALIHFDQDDRTEWIYRGSTRLEPLYLELQAAKAGGRSRLGLPRTKQIRTNMPCVEYTRSDGQANAKAVAEPHHSQAEELRRQRAVAKKSTTDRFINPLHAVMPGTAESISRVVYYTPKHIVKPSRLETHTCNPTCDKRPELLTLKDLRTYNPLAKPLLSGWERQTAKFKGLQHQVIYRAPCGRRLRNMAELHRYLRTVESVMSVDLFDFTFGTHCLAEFTLNKCIVGKKDLSHGKENVPVPCVNYFDDSLPEFCSYNTERTPTAGVPLNLDPDFLCGCDCTDDCQDKSKCACWKMTLEGARTIGLEGDNIGYEYRRLPEPLPSGIYECNSRCKCKMTCLNRVAQHPLQLKLQVFKTNNRGWGIRALNDVPKGAFLCVYAGNLLTDATANLDGLNEGDEYLAELDYIEVVEGMKEGYEDDIPEKDKELDKKGATRASESQSESSSESEEEKETGGKDHDFQPNAYIPQPQGGVYFEKSLRKREKAKKKEEEEEKQKEQEAVKKRDNCITISDDEEVREPSRFTADDIADKNTKHSSRVSVRTLFGKDEACYIMDAKVQGNIGRYLNHSCRPNVFVQNVFVDTHDPRFPWVAFFALSHVRAGNELTWNYNYDVGSVPGWTDGMIDAHARLFSSKVGISVSTGLPSKVFRKVTHCIFDMDGTLLDSEFVYHKMIHAICEKYGRNYSKEMERKFCGGTDREICLAVVKELKMPISADEMENQLTNISSKMLPHSPLMPGAERLLRHLHDYKVPMALATNSTEQAVRLHVVTKPAFFGMFNHKVSITDPGVLRGKPHPDLYLLAASKFQDKPKPAKCLVFEDSEKGVLAAKEAGMQVVMIPDIKIDREKTRNATLIIRSLLDFQPELFGLPPFHGTKGDKKMPSPTKPDSHKVPDTELHKTRHSSKDGPKTSMIERDARRRKIYESIVERIRNKVPDTELPKFEVISSKDGFEKSTVETEGGRISVDESIVERKGITLSVVDKFIGGSVMQERTGLDKQPQRISVIDKLLERKGTEKGGNEDKTPHSNSDEKKSKSIPESLDNRKVSISEGPYERKSITFEPERPFKNSMEAQHGRRRSIGTERKNQRSIVENKGPKSVKDQRKGADDQRHEKSKKEEKGSKRIGVGSKA